MVGRLFLNVINNTSQFIKKCAVNVKQQIRPKRLIMGGFATGLCVGFIPNSEFYVSFDNKTRYCADLPLVTGLIGASVVALSPILFINYLCNGSYFDRFIDKYDIKVDKYHQYDGHNNKYAFPSHYHIHIIKKSNN